MRISDWSSDVCSSDLVERRRHEAPVEIALALGKRRDQRQLIVIDKDLEVACVLEIDLGREIGCRFHLLRLTRSEEHTSELQSLMRISYAVFCLKKKT